VYVVRPDSTAEMRAVVVRRTVDGEAVIGEGLQAGETVVTDGQLRVVPGGPVVGQVRLEPEPPRAGEAVRPPAARAPDGGAAEAAAGRPGP